MALRFWSRCAWLLAHAAALIACSSTTREEPKQVLRGELGLNDVSMLFPLPETRDIELLIAADTPAAYGQVLPRGLFDQAPDLVGDGERTRQYQALRVVAARIDPCFPSLALGPSPDCRFQVRLVLSPLVAEGSQLVAEDAALHLFYDLPSDDFVGLLAALLEARKGASPVSPSASLGVHPTMLVEGLSGPYAERVRTALLGVIGAERLSRLTFTSVAATGERWSFGGFEIAGGKLTPIQISSAKASQQVFENTSADPLGFAGTVTPAPIEASDDFSALYDTAAASSLSEDELWPLYEALLQVENPERHSPESIDCVSCHTAEPARSWLERTAPFAERDSPFRFESSFALSGHPAVTDDTKVLRAFGWHGTRPAVSQRAVNDSAAVAGYLNRNVLTRQD